MFVRWYLIVCSESQNSRAICLFDWPPASARRTSISRGVRSHGDSTGAVEATFPVAKRTLPATAWRMIAARSAGAVVFWVNATAPRADAAAAAAGVLLPGDKIGFAGGGGAWGGAGERKPPP